MSDDIRKCDYCGEVFTIYKHLYKEVSMPIFFENPDDRLIDEFGVLDPHRIVGRCWSIDVDLCQRCFKHIQHAIELCKTGYTDKNMEDE